MSNKRKSYTIDYKLALLEEAERSTQIEVANKYSITARMLQKWKVQKDAMTEANKQSKRIKGGGRKICLKEDEEDQIFEWILSRRNSGLVVSRKNIMEYAHGFAKNLGYKDIFKASAKWLQGFLERYDLSLRRSTTLFKLEDDVIISRVVAFKIFIDNLCIQNYDPKFVVAMDETAVYFGEATQTTIDKVGQTSIYVPSTGYESFRVTVILAINRNVQKIQPFLISKGNRDVVRVENGCYVLETQKAWGTQPAIRKWISAVFPRVLRNNKRGLLIWDSASTHRAKDMKTFLARNNIDQVMIPSGTTGYLQSLDLVINKPFKDNIREQINEYIEHRLVRNARGNYKKPPISEVIGWVKNSWDKISQQTVYNALKSSYLATDSTWEQTAIAKHQRLGSKVANQLQNQAQPITIINDDDEIPEEDEAYIVDTDEE